MYVCARVRACVRACVQVEGEGTENHSVQGFTQALKSFEEGLRIAEVCFCVCVGQCVDPCR